MPNHWFVPTLWDNGMFPETTVASTAQPGRYADPVRHGSRAAEVSAIQRPLHSGFTQHAPPGVASCFQNGARFLSSSIR